MEKGPRNQHYSVQRGHWQRGLANRFRQITGVKPSTLRADTAFDPRRTFDMGRSMRKVTWDGKSRSSY